MKKRFLTITILFLLFATLMSYCDLAEAQFDDIPHDNITVDLGLAGDRGSQSNSLTAVFPYPRANGWFGVHALRTTADSEVLSDVVKAHAQGGIRVRGVGFELFVDAERDKIKGTDLTTAIGYFIRPGIYDKNGWQISGGAGNFIENVDARDELGLTDADGSAVRWLVFASIDYRGVTTLVKATPLADFSDSQVEVSPSVRYELKENVSLGLSAVLEYHSNPLTAQTTQMSYLMVLRLGF